MNKQTVYIPTKVEDESVPNSKAVFTFAREPKSKTTLRMWNTDEKPSDDYEKEKSFTSKIFTHWLKPVEGYVFTAEELKQLLEEYTNNILENVDLVGENVYVNNRPLVHEDSVYVADSNGPDYIYRVNKEAIKTQLETLLNKLECS